MHDMLRQDAAALRDPAAPAPRRQAAREAAHGGGLPRSLVALATERACLLAFRGAPEPPPAGGYVEADARRLRWTSVAWRHGPQDWRGLARLDDRPSADFAVIAAASTDAPEDPIRAWRCAAPEDAGATAQALWRHLGETANGPALLHFLLQLQQAGASDEAGHGLSALVADLVRNAAVHAGFVEVALAPARGGLLLQGWTAGATPATQNVVVLCGGRARQLEPVAAYFPREDLSAPARGLCLFDPDADAAIIDDFRAILFEVDDSLKRLDALPGGLVRLPPETASTHVSELLRGGLGGAAASMALFEEIGAPRYGGRDTVNGDSKPVAAAVDAALLAADGALLILGWVLDPEDRIASVVLSSAVGPLAVLDEGWTRLPRPDLNEGFAASPKFAARLSSLDVMHGFVAHAPRSSGGRAATGLHLEFRLVDGDRLFLPVAPAILDESSLRAPACAGLACDTLSLDAVVRDHLAPVMGQGRPRGVAGAKSIAGAIALGDQRARCIADAVMPFDKVSDLLPVFAALAGAPEAQMLALTLVAPRDAAARALEPLKRAFAFHGLSGRLVAPAVAASRSDLLDAGFAACGARFALLWTPSVLPDGRGWLAPLLDLAQAHDALVSPTLIYEDGSIAYGGRAEAIGGVSAPAPLAGYAREWIPASGPIDCTACATDFVAAPRSLIERCGGWGGDLFSGAFRHVDLSRRVRGAGGRVLWAPSVRCWMLDEAPPPLSPTDILLRRIDEAILAGRNEDAPA